MIRKLVLISALFLLIPAVAFAGICSNYERPKVVSKSDFQQNNSGTLGVRYSNRYLVFLKFGCYDMHRLTSRSTWRFFLNYDVTEKSFFSAAVTKIYPYLMRDTPTNALELYRNGGVNQSGVWVRASENEGKYISQSLVVGSEIAVLPRLFDTEKDINPPLDVGEVSNFSNLNLLSTPDAVKNWHALLSNASNPPDVNQTYRVFANTRSDITNIVSHMSIFDVPKDHTMKTKLYLIKFSSSGLGVFNRPILAINSHDCIYIRYQISDGFQLQANNNFNGDMLVLRTKSGASC